MVAAQQEEVLGVLHLVREQQYYHLEPVLPAVDVVAEEQIVGRRREAARLEDAEEVDVLAVDVADDLHRRLELERARLVHQDPAHRLEHHLDLLLRQLAVRLRVDLAARILADLEQLGDDGLDDLVGFGVAHYEA